MGGKQHLPGWLVAFLASTLTLLAAPSAWGVNKADVDAAVARGVAYLRAQIDPNSGEVQSPGHYEAGNEVGVASLVGTTLLEAEVAPADPAIQVLAKFVRGRADATVKTYSVALAIMFLDRLGDVRDQPLIEALALRLMAAQTPLGGWTYETPVMQAQDIDRLRTLLRQRSSLTGERELPKPGGPQASSKRLASPEIEGWLKNNMQQKQAQGTSSDDNSNTQFGVIGLWIARRSGLPVDASLALADTRFRRSQGQDGGWSYLGLSGGIIGSTPTMTCVGLLAVGINYGVAMANDPAKARDPRNDPSFKAGLLALGSAVGHPGGAIPDINSTQYAYYFLWSMERVCTAFDLTSIGGKDWFNWGAEIILRNQHQAGAWGGSAHHSGPVIDTCFAILFLRRANLLKDLTASLKGRVGDPAKAQLVGTASSPQELLDNAKKKIKPAFGGGLDQAAKDAKQKPPATGASVTKPAPTPTPAPAAPTAPAATAGLDPEVAKLSKQLVDASGADRSRVLEMLRDSKGIEKTEALAVAIPQLSGKERSDARDALAERMLRLKASSLTEYLKHEDAELRGAAARAVPGKGDKTLHPRLVELLDDSNSWVKACAYAALRSVAGKDLGRDAAAWKEWLKQ